MISDEELDRRLAELDEEINRAIQAFRAANPGYLDDMYRRITGKEANRARHHLGSGAGDQEEVDPSPPTSAPRPREE